MGDKRVRDNSERVWKNDQRKAGMLSRLGKNLRNVWVANSEEGTIVRLEN